MPDFSRALGMLASLLENSARSTLVSLSPGYNLVDEPGVQVFPRSCLKTSARCPQQLSQQVSNDDRIVILNAAQEAQNQKQEATAETAAAAAAAQTANPNNHSASGNAQQQ